MSVPAHAKTWVYSMNNRIPYVSVFNTMQQYLHGVKTFLKANGYVCKGSSASGVGAMDGTDRWTTPASVTPRATAAAQVQPWIVLTDGNGFDLLITYQGAADYVCRISSSQTGAFVVASTPTHQPTAVDEVVFLSGVDTIDSQTGDRLWFGWVDSEHKMCRFAIARSGMWTGQLWGLELGVSTVIGPPAVWNPPVFSFAFRPNAALWNGSQTVGFARPIVASVGVPITLNMMMEVFNNQFNLWGNVKPEAQGGLGYPMFPLSLCSTTTGGNGKLCTLIDWYLGRSAQTDGDTMGSLQWINMNIFSTGGMWPWDGATAPVLT